MGYLTHAFSHTRSAKMMRRSLGFARKVEPGRSMLFIASLG
jgi:hypothetical protein